MSALSIFKPRMSFVNLVMVTKHMATMIKAGIPLTEVLETVKDQQTSKILADVYGSLLSKVRNGTSFAESLASYPSIFDHFYTSLVSIGESSGKLDENLTFLAEQLTKENTLRKKIQSAVMYPALVFISVTVMGGLISFFILPQLIEFFDAFEVELPITTKILLWFAHFIKDYGLLMVVFLAAAFVAFSLALTNKTFRYIWHKIMLKLPLFGKLIFYGQLARMCRNLGILLQSGVPVLGSIETTSNTLNNLYLEKKIEQLAQDLNKGTSIGKLLSLEKYEVFPKLMTKMVAVGEKTGKLDETLLYLAEFYEEEIDTAAKNVTTLLEPVLLLILGLGIGFVALAIITPIYELTGSI